MDSRRLVNHVHRSDRTWRDRVAYLASPWCWPRSALAVLVVVDLALFVAMVVAGAVGPQSGGGKVVVSAMSAVIGFFVFLRPAVRCWRRARYGARARLDGSVVSSNLLWNHPLSCYGTALQSATLGLTPARGPDYGAHGRETGRGGDRLPPW